MELKVYNVLKRKKEYFIPQEKGKVKMYACGITASGNAHIGHAFQACVFDMIKKYMEYLGYEVTYVRNYTDVDDKIIDKSKRLNMAPVDYAQMIMEKTDKELKALYVDFPTIQSKATECMDDIINIIKVLEEKGYAYKVENGDVFFKVDKFTDYGRFSNRISDNSIGGVRIDVDINKQDVRDFALWKSAKEGEISWVSPWGKGRPGWHIECSAMSMKYLGETLDIHGGGKDLVFPHHENEIAQSEAATGKQFSKYWLHNGLIKVNGQKMSKSLGNGILLQDILEKYIVDVIRITLHQNHYRSDVNIMDGMFEQYEKKVYNLYKTYIAIEENADGLVADFNSEVAQQVYNRFTTAMNNDFNTSLAIADLFQYVASLNKYLAQKDYQNALNLMCAIKKMYAIVGICQMDPLQAVEQLKNKYLNKNGITENEINKLLKQREDYKREKNYQTADEIKIHLSERGIEVKDSTNGTSWDVSIN